jgi:hypothetical protein
MFLLFQAVVQAVGVVLAIAVAVLPLVAVVLEVRYLIQVKL